MKNRILTLLLLLFTSSLVFAQQNISLKGTIKDAGSKEALTGVTVFVESLKKGTSTDIDGHYELSLPEGSYDISFSFVGYITETRHVNIHNSVKTLDINLKVDNKMLDEVVISSQRKDANVRELKMSVQTIDMVRIKKIPALMGEVDVIKTIQLMPGVHAASEGSSGFSVRGGNPDQNLILLDNVPIYNASHFLGFFSIFNNDVIKDATLYKGDIPAMYDSRLSSVLDITTLDEIPHKFNMQGGIGALTSRLTLGTPFNKGRSAFLIGGRITYGGVLACNLIKRLRGNSLHFYDFNAKIMHTINNKNRVFISTYLGDDVLGVTDLLTMKYGNKNVTARWNHIFNDKLTSNLSLFYTNYRYDIGIDMNPYQFNIIAGIEDVSAKYDFTYLMNDNITSRFGAAVTFHQYGQGRLKDETGSIANLLGVDPASEVVRKGLEYALYYTNDHKLGPLFSIRYGLRLSMFQNIGKETLFLFDDKYECYDQIDYGKGEIFNTQINLEPRLGAIYQINEFSSIKASYLRTVQYAQVATNATGGIPFDLWFPASPNIEPQKCDQFALGYFRNFLNDEIETSVEVYYKKMHNVIDFVDNASFIGNLYIDGEVRKGKGYAYGIEFLARKNFGDFSGWISYTYSKSMRKTPGINFDREYVSPYDKPHNISIVLNYAFNKRFDVSATWVYTTGQPVTYPCGKYTVDGITYAIYDGRNNSRYPDYHRLDLSATIKCKEKKNWQGEWNFSVYNAYGRKNVWAVLFIPEGNTISTQSVALFSFIPSVSYNFKF
ncbi:MAG: carboxypeptidase-like regulatory domain-containing protein [Bacteroidales bacterium]|nr:carboxypeptidase-like regulatory domain-containing protein [Bacteroidales bacterium]